MRARWRCRRGQRADELTDILTRREQLAGDAAEPQHRFATTADNIAEFAVAGSFIFGQSLKSIEHIDIDDALCLAVVSFVCSDLSTVRELKNYFLEDGMSIVSNYESIRLKESNAIAKKESKVGGRGVY